MIIGLNSGLNTKGVIKNRFIGFDKFTTTNTGTASPSSASTPSGWAKADSGNMRVYGEGVDEVQDTDLTTNQNLKGWTFDHGASASTATGPGGGVNQHPALVDEPPQVLSFTSDSGARYMLYESSLPAVTTNIGGGVTRGMIRTNDFDLSDCSRAELRFYYHVHGATFGHGHGLGIAVTNNIAKAFTNLDDCPLGFTSDTAGGAPITYIKMDGTRRTTFRLGDEGQIQTSGHTSSDDPANQWRLASADISNACGAGNDTMYMFFLMVANGHAQTGVTQNFTQDLAIDKLQLITYT